MVEEEVQHLRVLIANERRDRLELLAQVVAGLGHEMIARSVEVHALGLIEQIVLESTCPVIALLSAEEPAYVHEAAKRGVFAYIVDTGPEELQSAIDITLQRFTEYHNLQGAFGRRAVIEQAKGILMARHLRDHSQHNGRKLADIATAIVESQLLLVPGTAA